MSKKILVKLIFCGSVLIASCTDLGEVLRSDISAEEHYSTVLGIEDLSIAIYEPLYKYYGRESGEAITETGTDIYKYGSGARDFYSTYGPGLNASNTARGFSRIWTYFYRGINLCNALINRADDAEGITDAQRTRWVAEARFLRAHYYHILVLQFGAVHLTLEETIGVEIEANRTPVDEIWAAIIEDLEFAIQNLPINQTNMGRASAHAARHNLAYVHLIRGNWEEAAEHAINIINSGDHSLLENYADLWDPALGAFPGPRHEEVIWGLPKNQDTRDDDTISSARDFGPRYHTLPGLDWDEVYGRTSSRYRPTRFLVEEVFGNDPDIHDLNIENDTRYHATFREVWYYNAEAGLPEGAALGDTAAYWPIHARYQDLTNEEVASKPYDFRRISDWNDFYFSAPVEKFRHQPDIWGRNVQIMRLAETYLIAAEALMMLNELEDAANYFNIVRKRAEAPGTEIPLITPEELNIDEILNERARELYGEYRRWYDLKRMGTDIFLDRIRTHNPQAAPNIQEYHMLRPIPQAQIDRTSNDYPQNPGY